MEFTLEFRVGDFKCRILWLKRLVAFKKKNFERLLLLLCLLLLFFDVVLIVTADVVVMRELDRLQNTERKKKENYSNGPAHNISFPSSSLCVRYIIERDA